MMRPTNQEMTATEKIVCYLQFPRGGACHAHRDTWGSTGVCEEAGVRGKHEQVPLLWFLWEELARLSNFSRLWGAGVDPSSLVPGPEVTEKCGQWPGRKG